MSKRAKPDSEYFGPRLHIGITDKEVALLKAVAAHKGEPYCRWLARAVRRQLRQDQKKLAAALMTAEA